MVSSKQLLTPTNNIIQIYRILISFFSFISTGLSHILPIKKPTDKQLLYFHFGETTISWHRYSLYNFCSDRNRREKLFTSMLRCSIIKLGWITWAIYHQYISIYTRLTVKYGLLWNNDIHQTKISPYGVKLLYFS